MHLYCTALTAAPLSRLRCVQKLQRDSVQLGTDLDAANDRALQRLCLAFNEDDFAELVSAHVAHGHTQLSTSVLGKFKYLTDGKESPCFMQLQVWPPVLHSVLSTAVYIVEAFSVAGSFQSSTLAVHAVMGSVCAHNAHFKQCCPPPACWANSYDCAMTLSAHACSWPAWCARMRSRPMPPLRT